nr:ARID DNA-binding domain-containing protein [Tanacetum cinerariifolium]
MEDQRKFLFTYGMGEVLIKNGSNGYLIPGVHYAPKVTLNVLSISLLKQQGFDINFKGDRCTLEYMFKNQQGMYIYVDRMRLKHNDYLDEYYKSLDKERKCREEETPRYIKDTDTQEIYIFNEFVAFLNLIKNDNIISKGWDIYRHRFDKENTKILGKPLRRTPKLEFEQRKIKRDEEERIGKCISQKGHIFKSCPAKIRDDTVYKQGHPKENAEERVHYAPKVTLNVLSIILLKQQGFDINFKGDRCTLEYMFKNQQGMEEETPRYIEDTDTQEIHIFNEFVAFLNLIKNDNIISKGWDIYRHRFDKDHGHYAFECTEKSKGKDQVKDSSYKGASTSKHSEDPYSTPGDDFIIIT